MFRPPFKDEVSAPLGLANDNVAPVHFSTWNGHSRDRRSDYGPLRGKNSAALTFDQKRDRPFGKHGGSTDAVSNS